MVLRKKEQYWRYDGELEVALLAVASAACGGCSARRYVRPGS